MWRRFRTHDRTRGVAHTPNTPRNIMYHPSQTDLFAEPLPETHNHDPSFIPNLKSYDRIIIANSYGKDSLASHLRLIELGVPPSQIEWWHHDVDDRDNSGGFICWPFEKDYGEQLAAHFGVKLYVSAKKGGFRGEMLRENSSTAGTWTQTPTGIISMGGNSQSLNTRRKFPQVTASLQTRWCSAYTKIMVASAAITNQERFNNSRTLIITGERAQESPGRAKYIPFKPHTTDRRSGKLHRHVDHWHAVHSWTEQDVWNIIQKHQITPAIPYMIGFSRFSCAGCIFGSADHYATLRLIMPDMFESLAQYEEDFGCTIKRNISLKQLASQGTPFRAAVENPDLCAMAASPKFTLPIISPSWTLPAGAFKHSGGPS